MAERFKLVGGVFNLILRDGKVLMELRKINLTQVYTAWSEAVWKTAKPSNRLPFAK